MNTIQTKFKPGDMALRVEGDRFITEEIQTVQAVQSKGGEDGKPATNVMYKFPTSSALVNEKRVYKDEKEFADAMAERSKAEADRKKEADERAKENAEKKEDSQETPPPPPVIK